MKKTLLIILPAATIVILFSAYSGNKLMSPGGAPAGYTGSPGDGQDCTACHDGTATTVPNWITSNVGPEGYNPGETYTITATATGSGSKGFEVSPQNPAGDFFGSFVLGPGTELKGSGNYITQSSPVEANPAVWSFEWVAPAAGSGPVTMYGAFAIGFDETRLSTLLISENLAIGVPEKELPYSIKVSPNPADKVLNVSYVPDKDAEVHVSLIHPVSGITALSLHKRLAVENSGISLDCSSLANGLYIVMLEHNGEKYSTKVIIQH